jgi:lipopolysaccharide export system permease protein
VKFFTAIDRYIFRLVLMPMLAVFVIAASLLVLDKMLKLFDFVATQGGPVGVVFRMLASMFPEYASLAIPLGLMLGVLMAFRRLSTSSELDVMRAVGLSYTRLLRVPYLMAVVLACFNLVIVSYVQPLSRYYYEQMTFELTTGALGASIRVGEFNTLKDKMSLRIEQSRDQGRELLGIFLRVNEARGQVLSVTAKKGRFLALRENPDTIILRLTDGQIVQDPPKGPPRVLAFTTHDLPIDLPSIEKFRERGGAEREYFLPELLRIGWAKDTSAETRAIVQASLNYRLAEVVMILLLPLLAVALAVPPKRSSSSLGVFVSIVMVVAYHKVNEYGEQVSSLGKIDPWLALWVPFGIFAAIIVWMYYTLAYVPGGQPIGALETFFAKSLKRIVRLMGKRRPAIIPAPQDDEEEQAA